MTDDRCDRPHIAKNQAVEAVPEKHTILVVALSTSLYVTIS